MPQVAKAPDGNGGLYRSLQLSGALDAMVAAGIEVLDCYCVDNILARLGDPAFIGCCVARGAQVRGRSGGGGGRREWWRVDDRTRVAAHACGSNVNGGMAALLLMVKPARSLAACAHAPPAAGSALHDRYASRRQRVSLLCTLPRPLQQTTTHV